ncbi:Protein of unknown function, partial [Gryllus bimaculatus]
QCGCQRDVTAAAAQKPREGLALCDWPPTGVDRKPPGQCCVLNALESTAEVPTFGTSPSHRVAAAGAAAASALEMLCLCRARPRPRDGRCDDRAARMARLLSAALLLPLMARGPAAPLLAALLLLAYAAALSALPAPPSRARLLLAA